MSGSTSTRQLSFGFISLCEGPILGVVIAWWLNNHYHPPSVFVPAGLAAAAIYIFLLKVARQTALGTAVVIVSMVLWGVIGWNVGGYICRTFAFTQSSLTAFDALIAWKVGAALMFAYLAYSDKASLVGEDRY